MYNTFLLNYYRFVSATIVRSINNGSEYSGLILFRKKKHKKPEKKNTNKQKHEKKKICAVFKSEPIYININFVKGYNFREGHMAGPHTLVICFMPIPQILCHHSTV